jgi:molecular chaperone GrpE
MEAEGKEFDPHFHEAVDSVQHQIVGVAPNTIVRVEREGYKLGDRVLRPAQVIVAI